MRTKNLLFSLLLTTCTIVFFSCKKNDTSTLQVNLTDAPADFDEVNVDIKEVLVNLSDDSTGWISLNTNAKVYNLLALQNNVQAVLATGTVPTGMIRKIRFILGPDNTIVHNSLSYPLTIPSGSESGLKINLNKKLSSTFENIVVDFDAALSIKQEGGGYKLRPVLKIK
jgi:hypothetical protein